MATQADIMERIGISAEDLGAFCRKWKIRKLEVFGSALRDEFGPESDLDFLYTFDEGATWGIEFLDLHEELEALVGRAVDLGDRWTIERSKNYLLRQSILKETCLVFES